MGYTKAQVASITGERLADFTRWMAGQTQGLCDGRLWDLLAREYVETGCGPHGPVVYPWDLERYLDGRPVID